ncbi:MAG: efflux RND transporter permease subunit [Spirulinaceae cyanobacterium SM2_1_0]|nr:efflux RND transporter permease subunit [Spirulinaceae cyanobacterium SM2_1_0]
MPYSAAPTPTKPSLSAIAIRQHIGTLMLTLTAIVLGLFFLLRLPVDLLPAITYPRIGLRLDTPGLSPEVAVDEVTRPLEQALTATQGLQQIFSETREGQVRLDLYFQPGGNIDQALNDATAALNRARSRLPADLDSPRLFKFDPSQLPVYEFALTSTSLPGVDLRVFADEEIARELNVVPGVASVDVSGGVQEEVQVNLDWPRLQALGIGVTEVLEALSGRNQDISGGRLEGGSSEPLTRTLGKLQQAEEIAALSFATGEDGAIAPPTRVYLRDFATVVDGTAQQRLFVTLNGEPAIKVSVQKQPDANTVAVVAAVQQKLATLSAQGRFPEDVVMTATLDESRFIRNSLRNVAVAGLTGTGLAAIVVLFFLGSLRQTLIIIIAIPLATLAALLLMGLFGLSLNVFSLGGLALGVGIVVDNSIVMLESIASAFEQHQLRRQVARPPVPQWHRAIALDDSLTLAANSSRELESALLASTTTNLVAVVPFLLVGGFFALLFNELILTISFSVAASLLVALTIVPTLASRLLALPTTSGVADWWLLRQFRLRLAGLTRHYQQFLAAVLRWRWLTIVGAIAILGGSSFFLIGLIPLELLPRISTGQAELRAQFPPGTTLADNRTAMAAVDRLLLAQPEVDYTFITAGGGIFAANASENTLRGTATITLQPGIDTVAFADRLNQAAEQFNLADARLRFSPGDVRGLSISNSPVRGSDLDLFLQSPDAAALQQAGQQVLQALDEQATLARYRPDADQPQPEVQIQPDWERAAPLGLTAATIGNTVQTAVQGTVPTQLQRGDRLVDVRVQLDNQALQTPADLLQLPLFVTGDRLVRLSDVARIEKGQTPGQVQRLDQRQVFIIAGNLNDGASLDKAQAELDAIISRLELPASIVLFNSNQVASRRQLQTALLWLGGLAAFLVFVVMAVQYNSLLDPLVIILTVPLALAGGILGLFITQTAMSATVIVGAVLLVGIVVNNAIIMVERANQLRLTDDIDRQAAILRAAPERLRPILMTTLTTVLGLLPLALGIGEGSEFLQPLGVVVFSGLSLATGLTLFIIPCFYIALHDLGGDRKPPRSPQRKIARLAAQPQVSRSGMLD